MKQICLKNVSKKFDNNLVILNNCSITIDDSLPTVIKGKNGAGKSTFLQILLQMISVDDGHLEYIINNNKIVPECFFQHVSYTSPNLELIDEFMVEEFFDWLSCIKKLYLIPKEILKLHQLEHLSKKQLKHLSSGQYQRIKLLQAFYIQSDFIFLDEPCTNFDADGYELYNTLLSKTIHNRTLIIASNNNKEFEIQHHSLLIEEYQQ